jgi:hypothetical protein
MAKRSIRMKRHCNTFPSFKELVHSGMKNPSKKEEKSKFMKLSVFLELLKEHKTLKKEFRVARKKAKELAKRDGE